MPERRDFKRVEFVWPVWVSRVLYAPLKVAVWQRVLPLPLPPCRFDSVEKVLVLLTILAADATRTLFPFRSNASVKEDDQALFTFTVVIAPGS